MATHKELLIDTLDIRFAVTEDKNGKLIGKGTFARATVPTANRRIYPESVWRKNINRLDREMKERKVFGEADHPADGKTKLTRVSHLLTGLTLESDGTIIGEMEVIPGTPNGAILSALIDAGCTLGVSSRGYGSVKMNESGHDVVQDDYVLMTFDAVSDPANATSWPEFTKEGEAEESVKVDASKQQLTEVNPEEGTMAEESKGHGFYQEYDSITKRIEDEVSDKDLKKKLSAMQDEAYDEKNETKARSILKEIVSLIKSQEKTEAAIVPPPNTQNDLFLKQPPKKDKKGTLLYPAIVQGKPSWVVPIGEDEEFNHNEEANLDIQAIVTEMKEDNAKLTLAAKEMAFRLFLEKNISHHPKYESIVKSFGKLTKIESIEELKELTSVYMSEANEFVRIKQLQVEQKLNKIENEFIMKEADFKREISLKDRMIESTKVEVNTLQRELLEKASELAESKAQLYFENKIAGNSNAPAIRKAWKSTRIIDNKITDTLIESMTRTVESLEENTFQSVRESLKRRRLPSKNLVENAIAGTTIESLPKQKELSFNPLVEQTEAEFNKLAGLN